MCNKFKFYFAIVKRIIVLITKTIIEPKNIFEKIENNFNEFIKIASITASNSIIIITIKAARAMIVIALIITSSLIIQI